jgi:hypothetical protein
MLAAALAIVVAIGIDASRRTRSSLPRDDHSHRHRQRHHFCNCRHDSGVMLPKFHLDLLLIINPCFVSHSWVGLGTILSYRHV